MAASLGVSLSQLPLPPPRSVHRAVSVEGAQQILADLPPLPPLPPQAAAQSDTVAVIMPGLRGGPWPAGSTQQSAAPPSPLLCVYRLASGGCSLAGHLGQTLKALV